MRMYLHSKVIYEYMTKCTERWSVKKRETISSLALLQYCNCDVAWLSTYHVVSVHGNADWDRIKSNVFGLLCTTGARCFLSLKTASSWLFHSQTMHSSLLNFVCCSMCVFRRTPPINRDVGGSRDGGKQASNPSSLRLGRMKWKVCFHFLRLGCHILSEIPYISYIQPSSLHTESVCTTRAQMRYFRPCKPNRHLSFRLNLHAQTERNENSLSSNVPAIVHVYEMRFLSDEWVFRMRAQRSFNSNALHESWFKLTSEKHCRFDSSNNHQSTANFFVCCRLIGCDAM